MAGGSNPSPPIRERPDSILASALAGPPLLPRRILLTDPAARQRIPDPQADTTFLASKLRWAEQESEPHAELLRLSRPEPGRPERGLISPPAAHGDIAARVGTRRESVARELKALERAALVERRRGAIVLTDTGRLQELLDEAMDLM